ncbi:Flp pilus assembly complex ATPase component TadA [Paenibacillus alginolyticus]|uniref:CpaF family protein n=1 Tax=Paenibacillus alginolyticus TaxID=59839 RepID=UPI001378AD14|nr:ATPase, T2SS/T4P/T4SS family [Paenibacillus alginolyticus]MCY9668730.1 Flp pilus assembly complex ATPase component TadA [Paenibacillus alginolyticus]
MAKSRIELGSVLTRVYSELRPHHFNSEDPESMPALQQLILQVVKDVYPHLPREDKERLMKLVISEMTGFGPLDPLMRMEGVTDIQAIGPQTIHYTLEGKRQAFVDAQFRDEEHCRQFVHRLAIQCGRTFDESVREVDLDLADGSRLHAIKTTSGTVMTIRRPSRFLDLSFLLNKRVITHKAIAFLKAVQQRKLSWIIAGNTGSLKTTLIQLLLSQEVVSPNRVVAVIEEKKELRPDLPYVISMEEVLPKSDGQGGYQLRQYVRAAMRMYLDVLVIGELRGPEALDALRAANSGHQVISSIHAGTPEQALAALKTLGLTAGQVSETVIDELIAGGIRILVQNERIESSSGYRLLLKSISEVVYQDGMLAARPIFEFQEEGSGMDGVPAGKLQFLGLSEGLEKDFHSWGIPIEALLGGNK